MEPRVTVSPDGPARHRAVDQTAGVLVVDAANVVGSRPTGWWRDRAGAASTFVDQIRAAVDSGRLDQPVVVVLEGGARPGVETGTDSGVTVVHAAASGDDELINVISRNEDGETTIVTADRALRRRAQAIGAEVLGPGWLLDLLAE
jgi:hypothetical protein